MKGERPPREAEAHLNGGPLPKRHATPIPAKDSFCSRPSTVDLFGISPATLVMARESRKSPQGERCPDTLPSSFSSLKRLLERAVCFLWGDTQLLLGCSRSFHPRAVSFCPLSPRPYSTQRTEQVVTVPTNDTWRPPDRRYPRGRSRSHRLASFGPYSSPGEAE